MWFITNKIAFRSIKLIKCKWYCLLLYGSFEINQQVMIYCDLIVVNKFAWSQKPETRFPNIYGCLKSMPSSRLCGNEKPSLPSQSLQHTYYQMACSNFNCLITSGDQEIQQNRRGHSWWYPQFFKKSCKVCRFTPWCHSAQLMMRPTGKDTKYPQIRYIRDREV